MRLTRAFEFAGRHGYKQEFHEANQTKFPAKVLDVYRTQLTFKW